METQDIILEDNQLMCVLTELPKKATSQEKNIQSIIRMLNEEYGFEMADLARDFNITFVDPDTGKNKKQKLEVVVFEKGTDHIQDNIIRIAVVQDEKIK